MRRTPLRASGGVAKNLAEHQQQQAELGQEDRDGGDPSNDQSERVEHVRSLGPAKPER